MSRAELAERIRELRAQGMTVARVGEVLGYKRSHISSIINDPDGSKLRERHIRHRQRSKHPCKRCGKPCTERATICGACSLEVRTIWTRESVIEAIRFFVASEGRIPAATDWNASMARRQHRQAPAVGEGYPSTTIVQSIFGGWNAAIEAAGFTPRKSGTYEWPRLGGTRKATWPIETGVQLIAEEGWTPQEVAELYDVPATRIYSALSKRGIRVG